MAEVSLTTCCLCCRGGMLSALLFARVSTGRDRDHVCQCAVIPSDAPAVYGVVNRYLLPLAVPLLLFSADLR